MAEMTVDYMKKRFAEIVGWPYVSPGTNDRNGIDCSGAFVRAYKMAGKSIYHGSNRIERVFHPKFPLEYIQRPEKLTENLEAFRRFHENMAR